MVDKRLFTLFKFGITGMSGLVVDFSITWLFKDVFHVNKFIANALGFSAAVLSNYFINRIWTFQNKDQIGRQLAAFIAVSVVGLLLNTTIVYFCNDVFHINFYLSKIIAVGLVFFWNFAANYFFVFKRKETP